MRFLGASDGDLYEIDLVLAGVMVRSYGLLDGFIDAFDTWNPMVAAPLLRMQLDTLVRVAYLVRAPSATDVARHIVLGGEFRRLKDGDGKLLNDAHLIELADEVHPWVRPVYEATSGWVHFSPAHVRSAFRPNPTDDGQPATSFNITIPLPPERVPLNALEELLGAMTQATEELFAYVEMWEQRKGLPLGETRELNAD
jgi:hypothetical protein